MYIDLNTGRFEYDDGYCEGGYCGDISASTSINASFFANDVVPMATDGEWTLYKPTTFDDYVELANDTAWSTKQQRYFDRFTSKGPLYVFINETTGEKYQSHPATAAWLFDEADRNLGKQAFIDFLDSHPKFATVFSRDGYDYFYANQQEVVDDDFTPRFASDFDGDDVEACSDINASTDIEASFFVNDVTPVARDGEWEMWQPTTYKECRKLGGGTKWTFSSSNQLWFDHYINKGPIYIFINRNTGEKYASHPATASWFYDADDVELGKQALAEFLDEHPNFIVNEFADLRYDYVRNGGFDDGIATDSENPGWFLSDIESSTSIDAAKMPTRYQSVRDVLGEDEWYYIEDYLMNGDGEYSLDDILYDMDAWDHYADWKMQTYHKKPVISASTRIRARRYLR